MEGPPAPERPAPAAPPPASEASGPLERLAGFRFPYVAIFVFTVAYVFTVDLFETAMTRHFQTAVEEAVAVDPDGGPVSVQIHLRVGTLLRTSPWIRIGRVRVRPIVLAANGRQLLFAGQRGVPVDPDADGARLLPARAEVDVSVPHNSLAANAILVGYAAILITVLVVYTRRLTRQEREALDAVVRERQQLAERARGIEAELSGVRERLAEAEPEKELYAEEITSLESERARLRGRLAELEGQEATLRAQNAGARELEQERHALEELLEEATQDLSRKDDEIRTLQKQVKRTGKGAGKEADVVGRRLRTLYKNLEVDDHAIDGLLALGDESLKLRAEEALKKLSDEPETAGVRRKVGGLPAQRTIFEQAFAGKGRIYTTQGQKRRFRVVAIGAKNSQKTDLEYLSRLRD